MRRYDEDVQVRCVAREEFLVRASGRIETGAAVATDGGGPAQQVGSGSQPGRVAFAEASGQGAAWPEPAWGAGEQVPEAFVWRGRLYVVRAVLGRWVERHPWWRTVLDMPAGESRALASTDLEGPVWRLEAAPGRFAQPGVYDLAGRPGGRWRLRRVED